MRVSVYKNVLSYGFVCSLIICFCINTPSVWAVPPSPAGGNYLALDGKDDYAVLDFETFGVMLKDGTNELTVEAWVYPTSIPGLNRPATILAQQIILFVTDVESPLFRVAGRDWRKSDLILAIRAYAATKGPGWGFRCICMPLSLHEWHHIAFQVQDDEIALICDGRSQSYPVGMIIEHNVSKLPIEREDFVLGGYGCEKEPTNPQAEIWGSLEGYIDEVRISVVARYDTKSRRSRPEGTFEPDADTIALWHFDEPDGAEIFFDSSGNEYHLVGKNGATVEGPLAVNEYNKLANTWAGIKANGY